MTIKSAPQAGADTMLIGDEPCYTFDGFLATMGICARTYYRQAERGLMPPRICIGKTIFFRKSAVNEWLRAREETMPRRICANGHVRKPVARAIESLRRRRARRAA
jgi:predicted DNA-binding transcriptional regulator AlpA